MNIHDFAEDNAIGKRGEKIFSDFMSRIGIKFTDVSEDENYQSDDVDFLVSSKKLGRDVGVEVKNDRWIHRTGNVFFETVSNVDFDTQGCFSKSKADFMAIVSEDEHSIYFIKMVPLREFVEKNMNSLTKIERVSGSNSSGYLIPLSEIAGITTKVKYK